MWKYGKIYGRRINKIRFLKAEEIIVSTKTEASSKKIKRSV